MASAFQRRKIAGVFAAMDADSDGFLEKADFEALTARWMKVRDWAPGSEGYERIRGVMMGWWQTLREAADQDRDDRVTLDDVMAVIDQLREMADAVEVTARSMFEAVDQDGDGMIGSAEYEQVVTAWKGYEASADGIFERLDSDRDGWISLDEFVGLWSGFWIGDDPDSPSKWVFGPFEGDGAGR